MSIYTRYGDQGFTRLVGGGRAKRMLLVFRHMGLLIR